MKLKIITIIASIIVIVMGFIMLLIIPPAPSPSNLNQEISYLVSNLVENDKWIRNCVLSVMKGDGSYSWSCAAGIGSQDGQMPMTKDTPVYIASITKLYTASVIMRLYEKGALSLDDPMSKYLPGKLIQGIHVYKGRDYSNDITIRELLSHSSGIADYYTEKPKGGKSFFELFISEPQRSWTVDETIARVKKDLSPHFPPGTDTSYSDTNFQLLGKIIEGITGKPLHFVYNDYIFRPLGLKNTWLVGHSEALAAPGVTADVFYKDMVINTIRTNGSYWADGGIVSTAEEMIVFLKALNEGRIISRDTLKLMHNWHKLHFPIQYGYGTMYFKLPDFVNKWIGASPLWGHSGSTGSFLYYSEEMDLYMAGSIDQVESESKPFFKIMIKLVKAFQSKNS